MTTLAVALVLISAVFHATWNLFAKRASGGGVAFVWLSDVLATILLVPVVVYVAVTQQVQVTAVLLIFILGDAVLQLAYFLLLQRGYRSGDLSLVYPLARGTGPALSTLAAILFFGERPTPLAIGGAALVVVGVFVITGGTRILTGFSSNGAVLYGLATGVLIASYTLWDKQAVSTALIPPVILYYGGTLGRVALLGPYAARRWTLVRQEWREHRLEAFVVAVLSPLSYIMVLTALVFTPVSYVAPAREISILLGTALGARLLSEGDTARRVVAAATMVLGVVALALG